VKKEDTEKKIEEQAEQYRKRAHKDDLGKRHDRIKGDEARAMLRARRELKWPDWRIAGTFDRDIRQLRKHLKVLEKEQAHKGAKRSKLGEVLEAHTQVRIAPEHGLIFDIELPANTIWIDSITVRPSDTGTPFQFMVSDRELEPGYPNDLDMVCEVSSQGRRLTYTPIRPQRYQDQDECRHLHCIIAAHKRHRRFDLDNSQLQEYLQTPAKFDITLLYKLAP